MSQSIPEALETVVRGLLADARPEFRGALKARTRIDQDLGLDSLSRLELITRFEDAFGVRLVEAEWSRIETLGDLAGYLPEGASKASSGSVESTCPPPVEASSSPSSRDAPSSGLGSLPNGRSSKAAGDWRSHLATLPVGAQSLPEIFDHFLARRPDATQVTFLDEEGQATPRSFAQLYQGAQAVARGLKKLGLRRGGCVALMLPTGEDFFHAFFGIQMAGGVPVPMYPPVRPNQLEEHLRRQAAILRTARVPWMITVPEAKRLGVVLSSQVPGLKALLTPDEFKVEVGGEVRVPLGASETAFLQFTSGSTGDPKGVILSHANLLANVRAIVEAVQVVPEDVYVSWLPLYHDLGLIGATLGTLYAGMPLYLMSPLRFLRRPEVWLQTLTEVGGSLSAAPNFAYDLAVRRIPPEKRVGLDLSAWRSTMNGAEPVLPETLDRFAKAFGPYGYRPETMQCVYGLAESSVGVTRPQPGVAPRIDCIERESFRARGEAIPCSSEDPEALRFVGCGPPLPRHEVRIVDASGFEVPEAKEGKIQFRGPSSTSGYFENPEATAQLVRPEGWRETGDLGYLRRGELFVTGRVKDVLIRAGRNLYPHELEEAVGGIEGIRTGCVVVFGAPDPERGTDRLVVLAETRARDPERLAQLRSDVQAKTQEVWGEPPDDVVLAPPGVVLKTSSGKLRRQSCRKLYLEDRLDAPTPAWVQGVRLAWMTATGWIQRAYEAAFARTFQLWYWSVGGVSFFLNWLLVLLAPHRRLAWASTRFFARVCLKATGTPIRFSGLEHLPVTGPRVLVSNHQSVMDTLALISGLPGPLTVVAKGEMAQVFWMRWKMQKLGVIAVDRLSRQGAQAGAEALALALARGEDLLIYPEGTCRREAGILPFRLGAFSAAVEANAVVVPLAIQGTRTWLRPDSWMPRPSSIQVEMGPALAPEGQGFSAATKLRDRARAWILAATQEPDAKEVRLEDVLSGPSQDKSQD